MNKTLIVLLAVCLLSVHAFVKRDAPAEESGLDKLNKQVGEVFEGIKEQVSKTFDPETVKKGFNDMVESVNKAFSDLKPKEQPQA